MSKTKYLNFISISNSLNISPINIMYIELSAQIPDVTVGRAANAPHYEYMTTFGKRTAELHVDHELWRNIFV